MSCKSLLELIEQYDPFDEIEAEMTARLRRFLQVTHNQNPFARELIGSPPERGHVTGSAWVVNPTGTHAILLHHAKLGRWVQPGGHCVGECDVLNVALRETREETSLPVRPLQEGIFDVDVHLIPEYWNTPDHWHYDVRFLLVAESESTPVVSHESREVRWTALEEASHLSAEASIARMIAKTRQRFGH